MKLTYIALPVALVSLGAVPHFVQSAPLVYERFESSAEGTIGGGVTFSTDVIGPVVDYGAGPVANQYTAVFDGAAGTFVNHGTATQVTGNDFTVEALINLSVAPDNHMIAADWSESGNHRVWSFIARPDGALRFDVSHHGDFIGDNVLTSPAGLIEADKWYHVAAVKQGTTSRIFVDGVQVAAGTLANPGIFTGDNANLKIGNVDGWGGNHPRPFAGRLDEVRITESALGRADFINAARTRAWIQAEDGIPGTPAGVVLNTDAGPNGTAYGGVSYSSDVPIRAIVNPGLERPNTVSLAFDGNSGSYVQFGLTLDVAPGPDGGFTVEAFVRPERIGGNQVIAGEWNESGDNRIWALAIRDSGELRFDTSPNGTFYSGNTALTGDTRLAADEWYHVAAVYDGAAGESRIYVDYELVGLQSPSNPGLMDVDNALLRLGAAQMFAGGEANFQGLIDEFRITTAVLAPHDFLRVPEPGSALLLAVGLIALLLRRRRRGGSVPFVGDEPCTDGDTRVLRSSNYWWSLPSSAS